MSCSRPWLNWTNLSTNYYENKSSQSMEQYQLIELKNVKHHMTMQEKHSRKPVISYPIPPSFATSPFFQTEINGKERPAPVIIKSSAIFNNYTCEFCLQQFVDINDFSKHRRTHAEQEHKKYRCDKCPSQFKSEMGLKNHLKSHNDHRPYVCQACSASFKTQVVLNTHYRRHTGVQPYECKVCEKRFTQKSSLNTHMRIHNGDKRFICEHCDKTCTTRGNLRIHLRTHSGEKPFECSHCGKCFNQRSTLNTHKFTHVECKPYGCGYCNRNFTTRANLNHHLKKTHPQTVKN